MAVLERVPVDRIVMEARAAEMGRWLLAALLGVFYVVGWVARKAFLAVAVAGTSIKLGWQDAAKPAGAARGPS